MQAVKDKTVIVVEVFPGAERPYYIKSQGMFEGTYVRVAGTTRHVEDYMLRELILEGKNRYFDSEICQNMKITDNEIELLCKSMKETAIRNTWQDSEKAKIKDITKNVLISWGVLKGEGGEVYPTNAYALLTGRMFQQPVIQCGVFKGTNRAHFVDRREFEGSIQEQMESAYQYVLEKINMGMTIKGMYRQDVYELPTDSIRELIANAVAHRSYLEPGNIQVALFDDRLEITSPGMLLNNVTIAKMMEGYSKPRNPAIARAFAYMKIIEKWGTNAETNRETGTNIETNTKTNTEMLDTDTESVERILSLMREKPAITVKTIAQQLELSVGGVRYHINKLKKDGIVEHIGSSKKGTWVIHE